MSSPAYSSTILPRTTLKIEGKLVLKVISRLESRNNLNLKQLEQNLLGYLDLKRLLQQKGRVPEINKNSTSCT